jgi:hypothetical protein
MAKPEMVSIELIFKILDIVEREIKDRNIVGGIAEKMREVIREELKWP